MTPWKVAAGIAPAFYDLWIPADEMIPSFGGEDTYLSLQQCLFLDKYVKASW